jgi:hypothetical protein
VSKTITITASILPVIEMKRFLAFTVAAATAMFLAACGGGGSSASAPSNVNVVVGDTTATVTWSTQSGIEYWIWYTASTFIDISGCGSLCQNVIPANSPTVVTGLTDGTPYSFSINGRNSGGPGGPGSPSISVTPRLAGGLDSYGHSTWKSPGAPLGAQDLRGVAYGVPASNTLTNYLANLVGSGVFVAAGAGGALFAATVSNADGSFSWAAAKSVPTSANLNAVIYNNGRFLALGDNGTILLSTDGTTWAAQTSGTGNDLYAVANRGSGFIAVGANGTMLVSGDGINWGQIGPFTYNTLYGLTYGNGTYVAAGAAGTLLYSTDGLSWQTGQVPASLPDLKSVAYGAPQLIYSCAYTAQIPCAYTAQPLPATATAQPLPAAAFVAVGANGVLLGSSNGIDWTQQPSVPATGTTTFNAVTYGHQFVAVGSGGSIISSVDGLTWTSVQSSNPSQPGLYAIAPANLVGGLYANQYLYSAMGGNGTNMLAR